MPRGCATENQCLRCSAPYVNTVIFCRRSRMALEGPLPRVCTPIPPAHKPCCLRAHWITHTHTHTQFQLGARRHVPATLRLVPIPCSLFSSTPLSQVLAPSRSLEIVTAASGPVCQKRKKKKGKKKKTHTHKGKLSVQSFLLPYYLLPVYGMPQSIAASL